MNLYENVWRRGLWECWVGIFNFLWVFHGENENSDQQNELECGYAIVEPETGIQTHKTSKLGGRSANTMDYDGYTVDNCMFIRVLHGL